MKQARSWAGIGLVAGTSILLYVLRVVGYGDFTFGYMIWNLLLAAMPFGLSIFLFQRLKTSSWLATPNLLLTAVWLGFLPNSFYVVTDLIHIAEVRTDTIVFDTVMLLTFALAGLLLGYASVLMVHKALLERVRRRSAAYIIVLIFLLCSYAIYLGRYMRWNTWDVIINPLGLLANIVDSLVVPQEGSPMLQTTLLFFIFIGALYLATLQFIGGDPVKFLATPGKRASKKVK
jgi:uncharacterized membrane protein